MQCSIIFVVLAIIFGKSLSQRSEVDESQHECGGYCSGVVKPAVEYIKILKKRVESCEAKQSADSLSKIVRIEDKLDTLARHMADTLSKLALMDENVETLKNQTATQQQLESTLSIIDLVNDKLEALKNQTATQQELENTVSKFAIVDEKLETLRTQMATKQELEKSSKQSEEALSKCVLMDENVGTLRNQTATQQQLENTLSKIDLVNETLEALKRKTATQQGLENTLSNIELVDEKLKALRNQMAALQELEKSSQSRLQRLELFTKIGSKYYCFKKISLNWHDALEKCREMGAHLLSLQSKDEMEALRGGLKDNVLYWTDLNNLETGGEFISSTTGSNGTFFHWGVDQPNNIDNIEHCVALVDNKSSSAIGMHDYSCDTKCQVICEASFD